MGDSIPGFVPLGRDPESGLFEFAHVISGDIPKRLDDGSLEITGNTGMIFVLIPGGSFKMGTDSFPRSPLIHEIFTESEGKGLFINEKWGGEVRLFQPFLISKYEMTQAQYRNVREMFPNECDVIPSKLGCNGERAPMTTLNWLEFEVLLNRIGLRMPSESEWEYACRSGTDGLYNFEHHGGMLDEYAWYIRNADHPCRPCGLKESNDFGLHDMLGNAWEWCEDQYLDSTVFLSNGGARGDKQFRVVRGGSTESFAYACRPAFRGKRHEDKGSSLIGVRPACSVNWIGRRDDRKGSALGKTPVKSEFTRIADAEKYNYEMPDWVMLESGYYVCPNDSVVLLSVGVAHVGTNYAMANNSAMADSRMKMAMVLSLSFREMLTKFGSIATDYYDQAALDRLYADERAIRGLSESFISGSYIVNKLQSKDGKKTICAQCS